jgi:methionine sulfoxide reductase heme-binding subunit
MSVSSHMIMATEQARHRFSGIQSAVSDLCTWMQKREGCFYLGILLLLAFWVQDAFELRWNWLMEMQNNEPFKQLTGLVLVMYVMHQWYLALLRTQGQMQAARSQYQRHKQAGVWAALLFYFHSIQFGYAYLFLLSMVYFANVVWGLFNQETVRIRKRWFYNTWIVGHVSLSVLLVILISYHIFITFSYK